LILPVRDVVGEYITATRHRRRGRVRAVQDASVAGDRALRDRDRRRRDLPDVRAEKSAGSRHRAFLFH